jgi:hypothetical protein
MYSIDPPPKPMPVMMLLLSMLSQSLMGFQK